MHIFVAFPNLIFLVKYMAVLTGCLLLFFTFLRFYDSVQFSIFVIDWEIFKDSTLILVIMNQRSYQIKCPINDHQGATRFSECKLHLVLIFALLTLFLLCISLRSVIIEVFKFFINACSHIFTYLRISLVLNVRFLSHYTAHCI